MRVLALDTTTRIGSVALVVDDEIVDERPGDAARTHGERLPAELIALVTSRGLSLDDVDLFAVASGPGSFTGLRIGIATVQGLALTLRKRVAAVSALDALAHAAAGDLAPGSRVGAWMDAHRGDVFAALYRTAAAAHFDPDRLVTIQPAMVGEPRVVLGAWSDGAQDGDLTVAGDGVDRYRDEILRAHPRARIQAAPPLAGAIGRIGAARARRGEAVDPAAIQPIYVRRPDAEVDREKRALAAKAADAS